MSAFAGHTPGQSNFSSPVGDHGLSPSRPSHYRRSLSAGPHTPHTVLVCLLARHLLEHRVPGLNVPARVHLTPTMHREPLCPVRVLPIRGWRLPPPRKALPFPHRSYGLMRQTNSLPLQPWPRSWVFAGCCQPLLGIGPSRRYLRKPFPRCLDPYPGGTLWCTRPFLPIEHRPSPGF